MQIYGLYLIIVVILCFYTKPSVAKILLKRNFASRNEEDGDQAAESYGRGPSEKRKISFEDLNEAIETSGDKRRYKRSSSYSGEQDKRHNYYKKRDLGQLHSDALTELDKQENNANIHGSKYAEVLASFKIDNRLKTDISKNDDAVSIEKRLEKSKVAKRFPLQHEAPSHNPSNDVKTKREIADLEKIEQNILNVFDDLGIVETKSKENREKRDYGEDEDLESGSNKISMTKENVERSKKYDVCPKIENISNSVSLKSKRSNAPKILNYQYEGEEYIRNRRHDIETIVKDLETSGELTVSGNKSPLMSSDNNSDNKRGVTAASTLDNISGIKKRNNDNDDDEKMLEKNIQDKIFAIKSDVKREIFDLKERERKKKSIFPVDSAGRDLKAHIKSRELGDDLEEQQYSDLSDDNEMTRQRKDKSNADEVDFGSEDEGNVDRDIDKFAYQNGKKIDDEFKRFTNASDDAKVVNNSVSTSQESMPANLVGQVASPSYIQPPNQLQQPISQLQQQPIVNNNAAPSENKDVLLLPQANPSDQVTQKINSPQLLSNSPNQTLTGTVNEPHQDIPALELNQQQAQTHDTKTKSARSNSLNIGSKKSMQRQNFVNDYDDCYEDKVKAAPRSADLELEDGAGVRIANDNIDDDKTVDNEEDSTNEKMLVRQERFLQNITQEELLNLENENPSLEQRRRRQAVNHRGKRAYERIKRVRRNKQEHSNGDSINFVPVYKMLKNNRIQKRQALKSASAFSGRASPNMKHLRIQSNNRNYRKKRLGGKVNRKLATDINMEALSNCELFGGLPQSFHGELSRFKRVKRFNDY